MWEDLDIALKQRREVLDAIHHLGCRLNAINKWIVDDFCPFQAGDGCVMKKGDEIRWRGTIRRVRYEPESIYSIGGFEYHVAFRQPDGFVREPVSPVMPRSGWTMEIDEEGS